MKLSKKIIICIGLVVVMLSSGIYVMAHEISESGKIEVIFDENSIFTEEEKEIIEASFLENGDGNTPAPYGVMCTPVSYTHLYMYLQLYLQNVYLMTARYLFPRFIAFLSRRRR